MKGLCLWLGLSAVAVAQPWTLPQAEANALSSNPSAGSARQQVRQAQARVQEAQAGLHPQLTFTTQLGGSSADVLQPPPPYETFYTFSNSLNLTIPVGSRPGLLVAQAESQLAATQAQSQSARRTLVGQVVTAYFNILKDAALLEVARETEAEARRQLDDAQKRQRAGDVPELDVIKAQVPVTTAEATVLTAANTLHVAQITFNDLMGQNAADVPTLQDVALGQVPWPLEEAQKIALARSPEVTAAQANVQADAAALASARHYHTPTLTVSATDLRSSDVTAFSREDTVQAQAVFPVSDAGLGKAQVREAEAALEGARFGLATARKAALLNSGTAWANAQTLLAQVDVARTAQTTAQISYEKTREGYQNGLFPLTDVLAAASTLTQARLNYIAARYDAAAAVETLRLQVEGNP
ncbi:MAG TPA: TolC family protein [Candidatus Xenobia bacterium]|jgi:outer membrane protein